MDTVPTTWDDQDLAGTERAVDLWWSLLVAGVDPLPPELAGLERRIDAARAAIRGDGPFTARADAGDDLVAALSAAGRAVHAAGAGPARHAGTVAGVFASGGGVPKQPVLSASVGPRGVEGDTQATRRHHGRVWQALCLWSTEVVDALAAEGHPIFPGAAGENVSVSGVDWAALRPGTRLRLGTVLAEVTAPALPCAKNARWFAGRDFARMHHEREPGVSRLYALVLEPGEVAAGDPAVVEP